jgi:hypothetical protein
MITPFLTPRAYRAAYWSLKRSQEPPRPLAPLSAKLVAGSKPRRLIHRI